MIPSEFLSPLIAAASALLGVSVGGYFTALNQKRERQHRRIASQLSEFYSPMLGLRAKVLAQSELRCKISGAADSAWRSMIEHAQKRGIEHMEKVTRERSSKFDNVIEYHNRQLAEQIVPAYRNMIDLFVSKMHLAELSTIQHFPVLLEFVEIWNRALDDSIPGEVLPFLDHSEDKLKPFYEDLAENFTRMQDKLREDRRWWRRRRVVKVHGLALTVNPFAKMK